MLYHYHNTEQVGGYMYATQIIVYQCNPFFDLRAAALIHIQVLTVQITQGPPKWSVIITLLVNKENRTGTIQKHTHKYTTGQNYRH